HVIRLCGCPSAHQLRTISTYVSLAIGRTSSSSLFPYTTLFRSQACYDGADLDDVARELGMRREELVRRHVESEHVVSFLGFAPGDRKSTRLNSSHGSISYAVFCLKKKKQ